VQRKLVLGRFKIGVCLHDICGKNRRFRRPLVNDLKRADIARECAIDNQVIPETKRAGLCTYDTIVIMPGKNHGVQTAAREREGKQVALGVNMKHDGIKSFHGLASERATACRKSDKGLDDGEEM